MGLLITTSMNRVNLFASFLHIHLKKSKYYFLFFNSITYFFLFVKRHLKLFGIDKIVPIN